MLDIEETQRLAPYGIICLVEGGKKSYFKPRKLNDAEKKEHIVDVEFELVPVSSEEKKQYGIIEESAQTDGSEIDIEESEQSETEEEKAKKKNLTLTGSPEAVKAARSILEREMQKRNLGENSESDDLASMKLRMYEKFNKNPMFLDATSKSQLSAMVENHINSTEKENEQLRRGIPAGSALTERQYGIGKEDDLFTKPYDSWKSLVDDLNEKRHDPNYPHQKEAQSYWDEYERLWLMGKRTNPKLDDTYNPNLPENVPTLKDVAGTSARTPVRREEGDIAKILHSWKLQRERKMKDGSEQ